MLVSARKLALWGFAAGWIGVATLTAAADPVVQSVTHPGLGRLVFEFDERTGFELSRDGDHVVIRFDRPDIVPAAAAPRNVLAYRGAAGLADLDVAAGARVQGRQIGRRVVIDVRDPIAARPPHSVASAPHPVASAPHSVASAPHSVASAPADDQAKVSLDRHQLASDAAAGVARPPARLPAEQVLQLPVPGASNMNAVVQAVEHALAAPVVSVKQAAVRSPLDPAVAKPPLKAHPAETVPIAEASGSALPASVGLQVAAQPLAMGGSDEQGFLLPFSRGVGAAAFRRGDNMLVVFDERRPIDLAPAAGGDATPAGPAAGAGVRLLPDATMLTMPLPASQTVRLERTPDGWIIRKGPATTVERAIAPVTTLGTEGQVRFGLSNAGRSIVVPDEMTGGNLLVGTQGGTSGAPQGGKGQAPQGVAAARQSPGFVLLASQQGIAIEPLSDRMLLQSTSDGFRLTAEGSDLLASFASPDLVALAAGAAMTRRFDFPDRATPELVRRADALLADAALAPPRSRLAPRLAAAQALIALGLGPEAQALLLVAATDDPQAAGRPELAALSAIGGLLAGRGDADHALDDARLSGSDEIAFWRALAAAQRPDGAAIAAPVFAATLPLLLSYPPALRSRLLAQVAGTLVQGGELAAAERLLAAQSGNRSLVYARGLLEEARGAVDAALSDFDDLAGGSDRRLSARAADEAVALRLRSGRVDAARAADLMERGLFRWRETPRELTQRRKIAELRAQAHAWRPALAMLREAVQLYPEEKAALQTDLQKSFAAMLQDQPAVSALDLVMIADENADLMQHGEAGEEAATLLADRLAALDLPERAVPLLDRMMHGAQDPVVRARLGLRLAAMQFGQGDAISADAALAASEAADLPSELAESRQLLRARVMAAKGEVLQAVNQLISLGTGKADLLRADLSSEAKDWPGAEAALQNLAARLPTGELSVGDQDILLRLAGAAAQAGDEDELQRLQSQSPRLAGHRAELFRMITEAPVAKVDDLPRAAREAEAARALPAQVQSLAASDH